jgi:TP53 regulating kinase-like protein
VRSIAKCRSAQIETPAVYHVDVDRRLIFMEFMEGMTVRDYIYSIQEEEDYTERSML